MRLASTSPSSSYHIELCGEFFNGLLEEHLERQYCMGNVWYEDDLVSVTAEHLRAAVVELEGYWLIGTNHPIGRIRPDLTLYFAPARTMPDDFYANRRSYVVAFLEFKFANQGDDLEKLTRLQQESSQPGLPVIAWRVFGDHFSPEIHPKYAADHERLAKHAKDWASEEPLYRGCTLIRCGVHQDWESPEETRVRDVTNRFWIRGRLKP